MDSLMQERDGCEDSLMHADATIAQQQADIEAFLGFVGSVDTFYTFPIDGEQAWWENDINADGEPDEEYWDVLNRRADLAPIIERYRAGGE
jgi:hypothetical protein